MPGTVVAWINPLLFERRRRKILFSVGVQRNLRRVPNERKRGEIREEHSLYRKYKQFCDEYFFYIPARLEHRGVGGLFFDVATSAEANFASVAPSDAKAFTKAVTLSWLDIWEPIATRNKLTNNRKRNYLASSTKRSIFGIQPFIR